MTETIEERVWETLTVKQRGCDHGGWAGRYKDPQSNCVGCGITLEQYDKHEKETNPLPQTPFWTWQLQYEQRMGIESDYHHTPI